MPQNIFHISVMASTDITEVMAIENTTVSPWSEEQMRAELTNKNGWRFVCRRQPSDELIGFITGTRVCDDAEIRKIAIKKQHRRIGAAYSLLQKLFWYLKKQGATRCLLELRDSNRAAKTLYQNLNFQINGRRTAYYNNPIEDAILMTKIL